MHTLVHCRKIRRQSPRFLRDSTETPSLGALQRVQDLFKRIDRGGTGAITFDEMLGLHGGDSKGLLNSLQQPLDLDGEIGEYDWEDWWELIAKEQGGDAANALVGYFEVLNS